jgi:DNA-binding beta-propeller fold protein YncE
LGEFCIHLARCARGGLRIRLLVAKVDTPARDGCPYGLAPTATDGVVDVVTGSDNTLKLGHKGDVLEQVDFRSSTLKSVHGVGPDPVTLTTDPKKGLAYVVDADSPLVTVVDLGDLKVVGRLDLDPRKAPLTGVSG